MMLLPLMALAAQNPGAALPRDYTAQMRAAEGRAVISDQSASAAAPGAVVEQPNPAATVFVGAVNVAGADVIERSAFAPVIADYLGRDADGAALQSLARAVATAVRVRGYVFASAMIPEQTVAAGTVTVMVDAGAISEVRLTGTNNRRVRAIVDKLVGGPLRRDLLERQLLLVGDVPGLTVTGTRFVRENGRGILIVDVKEARSSGYAGVDTYGTRDLDPLRLFLRAELTGIANSDDNLVLQAVATPVAPGRLAYASARYTQQVGTGGAQIGVALSAGRTRPSPFPGDTPQVADSRYGAVFGSAPLFRANRASVWLNGEIVVLRIVARHDDVLDQRDVTTTASLSLYGTMRVGTGRLSGSVGIVQGLPIGGVTRAGDLLASRYHGDAVFTKGVVWADYYQPLGKQFAVRLAGNVQAADRPLLSSQEAGLGGPASARAFDYYERFGDGGAMGSVELRWRQDKPLTGVDWVQLYGFADGGYVWNLDGGFGDGKLMSSGGGIRAGIGRVDFTIEAAVPIAQFPDSGRRSTRMNFSIGRRF